MTKLVSNFLNSWFLTIRSFKNHKIFFCLFNFSCFLCWFFCCSSYKQKKKDIFIAGDDYSFIKKEAISLIDSILEQSIITVNSQLSSDGLRSDSPDSNNFAISSDVGGEFIKSPTIESITGKSFDDNFSYFEPNSVDQFSSHYDQPNLIDVEFKGDFSLNFC